MGKNFPALRRSRLHVLDDYLSPPTVPFSQERGFLTGESRFALTAELHVGLVHAAPLVQARRREAGVVVEARLPVVAVHAVTGEHVRGVRVADAVVEARRRPQGAGIERAAVAAREPREAVAAVLVVGGVHAGAVSFARVLRAGIEPLAATAVVARLAETTVARSLPRRLARTVLAEFHQAVWENRTTR